MRYNAKVKPRSSKNEVVISSDGSLVIYTTKSPVDNKANESLRALLSEKFKVRRCSVKIISGLKSKNKIIEIK